VKPTLLLLSLPIIAILLGNWAAQRSFALLGPCEYGLVTGCCVPDGYCCQASLNNYQYTCANQQPPSCSNNVGCDMEAFSYTGPNCINGECQGTTNGGTCGCWSVACCA
jgi:hypothetical protein